MDAALGKTKPDSIINIASIGGLRSEDNLGFYNATKTALMHLMAHFALELGPRVRVNCVAPGLVRTDMSKAIWEGREEALVRPSAASPFGRARRRRRCSLLFTSNFSGWVTGQTLAVDGGALARPVMGQPRPSLLDGTHTVT